MSLIGVDSPDYSLFPNREYQLRWMRVYLEESAALRGIHPSLVSDGDVEALYWEVQHFVPVGDRRTCIGVVQSYNLSPVMHW